MGGLYPGREGEAGWMRVLLGSGDRLSSSMIGEEVSLLAMDTTVVLMVFDLFRCDERPLLGGEAEPNCVLIGRAVSWSSLCGENSPVTASSPLDI
jgi:hypothetical protein